MHRYRVTDHISRRHHRKKRLLMTKRTEMGDIRTRDLFPNLSLEWENALNEKRPRDVILSGVVAYILFREKGDQTLQHATLTCVRKAIDDLLREDAAGEHPHTPQNLCSFCGRGEPAVRLAAGARGFICDSCVATLSEFFA